MVVENRFFLIVWLALVFGIVLGTNHAVTSILVSFQRARGTCTQHTSETLCELQRHPVSGSRMCAWEPQFDVCIFSDTCLKRDPSSAAGCGEGCFADFDGDSISCYSMEGWPAGIVGIFAAAVSAGICIGSGGMRRLTYRTSPLLATCVGILLHAGSVIWTSVLWTRNDVINNSNAYQRSYFILSRFLSGCGCGIVHYQLIHQVTLRTPSKDQWQCLKMLYIFEGVGFLAVTSTALLVTSTSVTVVSETMSAAAIVTVFFAIAYGSLVVVVQPLGLIIDTRPSRATTGADAGTSAAVAAVEDERSALKDHDIAAPAGEIYARTVSPIVTQAQPSTSVGSKDVSDLLRVFVMLERSIVMAVIVVGPFISSVTVSCFAGEAAISACIGIVFLGSSVIFQFANLDSEMGDMTGHLARGLQILACLAACINLRSNSADSLAPQGGTFSWFLILATLVAASQVAYYGGRSGMKSSANFDLYHQIHLQSFLDGIVCMVFPILMGHGVLPATYTFAKLEWLFLGCGAFAVVSALVTAQEQQAAHNQQD